MKKFILLLIVPLFAQFSDVTTRLYEIEIEFPYSWSYNTIDTVYVNEEIGLEQGWYRLSPVSLYFPEANNDYSFVSLDGGVYGGTWRYHYQNDGYFNFELAGSPNADTNRLISGANPHFFVTGSSHYGPGILTLLITSNFEDDNQSGYDADWNGDGEINIIDVVAIIDYILFGEG